VDVTYGSGGRSVREHSSDAVVAETAEIAELVAALGF